MRLYKLTDENGQTRGGMQWGENVTHSATGPEGQPLCTDGWIHFYESPEMAAFMNPIHADFKNPQLWEAEGEIGIRDGALKCGCRTGATIRKITLPEITIMQRVEIAIRCALSVNNGPGFVAWAGKWISGEDRTEVAARAAEAAAWAEARAAARVAARAAAWVARAAAQAAAWAAAWAAAEVAAEAAAREAAQAAAWAAARAVEVVAETERPKSNILSIIRNVLSKGADSDQA